MDVTLVRANPPLNVPVNGAATTFSGGAASGNAIPKNALHCTFQVIGTNACNVIIEATNELATAQGTKTNWIQLGTVNLTGPGTDGFAVTTAWAWVRARVVSNAGTVNVLMGC